MGRNSQLSRHHPFCPSRLPLAQGQDAVASAQPADRHLHVHRRDPGGPAGGDGVHHSLSVCRPVREFRSHVRTGFPAAQPAIGKCRHCQRTGGPPGTRPAGHCRIARRTEAATIRPGRPARFAPGRRETPLAVCNGADARKDSVCASLFPDGELRCDRSRPGPALPAGGNGTRCRAAEADRGLERSAGPQPAGETGQGSGRDHALRIRVRLRRPRHAGRQLGSPHRPGISRQTGHHTPPRPERYDAGQRPGRASPRLHRRPVARGGQQLRSRDHVRNAASRRGLGHRRAEENRRAAPCPDPALDALCPPVRRPG